MTAGNFIATTERAGYHTLKHQGILASDSYQQISSSLKKNLSARHAAIFAEPLAGGEGDINWYTTAPGPFIPLGALSPDEQKHLLQKLGALAKDIDELSKSLAASNDPPSVTRGHILALALSYPALDNIYLAANGQPVLTCWGMVPAAPGVMPQMLVRSLLAPQASPAAAQPLPDGAPVAAPLPEAQPAPPTEPKPPASQNPAPEEKPEEKPAPGPWPWPNWAKVALPFFLSLTLTILAAFLLGRLPACQPQSAAPTGQAAPAAPAQTSTTPAPATAAQLREQIIREAELRARLQDLERQLMLRAAQCPKPAPPQAPEQLPEEKPVPPVTLETLLPQSQEKPQEKPAPKPEVKPAPKPPAKPAPKPEPKPVPTPEAKPEQRPEPKPAPPRSGDRLTIPPDAARNNDLSFLKGCWRAANTNCNSRPIIEEYCFDNNGGGTRTIYDRQNGQSYTGPMRARFDSGGNLILDITRAQNPLGNDFYNPEYVTCSQGGSDLRCRGKVIGEACVYNGVYYRK